MQAICKMYRALCQKWGPCHLTISAWLWKRELDGGGYLLREIVDDAFLCFFDQEDHCQRSYERETQP